MSALSQGASTGSATDPSPGQDSSTTFPRQGEELTSCYGHFRPYFDDVIQLHAAARLSSLKWAETGGHGLSKEEYLLAVADKAMEILEFVEVRDFDKDIPAKRSEWKKSLKKEVIPKAIAAAEKHQPLPVLRKEMVAFLLSALDANYSSLTHAVEPESKAKPKHEFMAIVTKVELPIEDVAYVSGPTFLIMSPRVGNNVTKARKALEHLNPLFPGYLNTAAPPSNASDSFDVGDN